MANVVLTGATGFLGREIVLHLLDTEPDTTLSLLVRGKDDADARRRGDELLSELLAGRNSDAIADAKKRVSVVRADIEKDRLGLDEKGYQALVSKTDAVIHGAASVSFTLPLEEARAINVEGTRRMLDLAKAAGARTDYVGTAYVAGDRKGIALESELDVGQPFRNTYEQTKMESEKLCRERSQTQPIAMFRPSIIVGDSATGRTASFKVLYWPLKMYARGFGKIVPGRRSTPIDVVPSDYVVKAIAHIRKDPNSAGRVYTLAAGLDHDATIGQLVDLASKFFRVGQPIFVNPELFIKYVRPLIDRFAFGKWRHRMITARVYTPYLNLDLRFDTRNAKKALEGTDIRVPEVNQYFSTLFQYCIDTEWGTKPA